MKKLILSAAIIAFCAGAVSAQEIPERKREESKPVMKERIMNKKERANLNLSDEQTSKLKSMNRDLHQQMEDLRKQDNLSVKEYQEKMETLRKDHQEKFQSILTPDQKNEMQKYKDAANLKSKGFGKKKQAKLKEELNLSDEQVAKMTENRQAMMEKMRAIRENKSLSESEQKDEMKELMKKQKESLKSVLTEDQMKKLKESRKHSKKKAVI